MFVSAIKIGESGQVPPIPIEKKEKKGSARGGPDKQEERKKYRFTSVAKQAARLLEKPELTSGEKNTRRDVVFTHRVTKDVDN